MEIVNLKQLTTKLEKLIAKANRGSQGSVIVGYTQAYALPVHENLKATHKEGKQAKFLEDPARKNRGRYIAIVKQGLNKGLTLTQSLLVAGLRLQRDSQLIVPVDTGALKNSAFTRLEAN